MSIVGQVILIVRAVRLGSGWHLAGSLVFGISLILLCLPSTLYHRFARLPVKAFFQRLDQSAIYFLFTTLHNGLG